MTADLLPFILKLNIVVSIAVVLVLVSRDRVRDMFGSRCAYRLWAIVPFLAVAAFLPARQVTVDAAFVPAPAAPAALAAPLPADPPIVFSGERATAKSKEPTPAVTLRTASTPTPVISEAASTPKERPALLPFVQVLVLGLYLAGAAVTALLLTWRQRRWWASLGELTPYGHGHPDAYCARTSLTGPAMVGILRPRIILPADFAERYTPEERELILAHEDTHRRHGDGRVNGVAAILSCLCWFNPLIHRSTALLQLDQELACDEAVVNRFPEKRRCYAETMLKDHLGAGMVPIGSHWHTPQPLKDRIRRLKHIRRQPMRAAAGTGTVALVSVLAGAAAWATQPPRTVERQALDLPEIAAAMAAAEERPIVFQKRLPADAISFKRAQMIINVIPENRDDYEITVRGASPKDMAFEKDWNLRGKEQKTYVITGNLPKNGVDCDRKRDELASDRDTMFVTLRTPMRGDVHAGGIVVADIGTLEAGDIELHGCGDGRIAGARNGLDLEIHGMTRTSLGDVDGPLDVEVHGMSGLDARGLRGPLDASIHGMSRLAMGDVDGPADLSVHGNSSAALSRVDGPIDASIHGNSRLQCDEADGGEFSIHGNSSAVIARATGNIELSAHGSSSLSIEDGNLARVELDLVGGSEFTLSDGRIRHLDLELSGGAEAMIDGTVEVAVIDAPRSTEAFIAAVGELSMDPDEERRGTVRIDRRIGG